MTHKVDRCTFDIVSNENNVLTIRGGIGGMTITNAAESVVKCLLDSKELTQGMRLLYWDTDGRLDELVFNEQGFVRFNLLPQQSMQ